MNDPKAEAPSFAVDEKALYWLRKWLDHDCHGVIGSVDPPRIGFRSWLAFLEFRHFRPGTPEAPLLRVMYVKWQGTFWAVAVFPEAYLSVADDLLGLLGLRRQDGIPRMIAGAVADVQLAVRAAADIKGGRRPGPAPGTLKMESFPTGDHTRLWTAENVEGHFAFRNDPALGKTAEQAELEAINAERVRWGFPMI
jgi:hypothetical protein